MHGTDNPPSSDAAKIANVDSRQQRRARVRAQIKEEVAQRFSGPRSGLRYVAREMERRYWRQNRVNRLMEEATKRAASS